MNFLRKFKKTKSEKPSKTFIFLEEFFPSERIIQRFGYSFVKNDNIRQRNQHWRKICFFALNAFLLALFVLMTIHFVRCLKYSNKLLEAIETLLYLEIFGFVMFKTLFLFYFKGDAIGSIYERLEMHFPYSEQDQRDFCVGKHLRILQRLSRVHSFIYFWMWMHIVSVLLFIAARHYLNYSDTLELFVPMYFPLDPMQPLLYPICLALGSFSTLVLVFGLLATDLLFNGLASVTSMEIDVLAQKIALIDPRDEDGAVKDLSKIIAALNDLTEIARELEGIFTPLLLANILAGIFILCICVFFSFVSDF
jgi:hypothetical protein